jgi:lipoprotein-anchoring transpeptidase ErfK/SrfK
MIKSVRFAVAVAVAAACMTPLASQARSRAKALTPEAVNEAVFKPNALRRGQSSPLALKLQVLLDRAHASPGVIDGVFGASAVEAVKHFQLMNGSKTGGRLTQGEWDKLSAAGGGAPILKAYEIQKGDVKGPFIESVPQDYAEKAKLKHMGYTSALEGLAEKFHMSEALVKALNPGKSFDKAGETIIVADPGKNMEERVERIEVDGQQKVLRAYGKTDNLLAIYPATVGSKAMPSPTGSLKVRAVAEKPTYYLDPKKITFAKIEGEEQIKIAPGPNNPVGLYWIDLDQETYGIHGTAEPSEVGKVASHGCVRLTNWDAGELAANVRKGVPVAFVSGVAAR